MNRTQGLIRASQWEAVAFILKNPYCGLFSNMGFGKTAAITTAVELLFRRKEVSRLLIVTTIRVAENTWPEELGIWGHTSHLTFNVITGDAETRLAAARGKEQIHTINQENFVWLAEKAGRTWPYDMVVFDDAKGLKNANRKTTPKATICAHSDECPIFLHEKSFVCQHAEYCPDYRYGVDGAACIVPCRDYKAVRSSHKACTVLCKDFQSQAPRYTRYGALCALRPQIQRLVHLTGTPTNKALVDLWPLIATLDYGKRLGKTYTMYKNRYFNRGHNGYGWELKPGSEAKIHKLVGELCVTIESEAEDELPPCHHVDIAIELPAAAAKHYDTFEEELVLELDGGTISAVNNGVLAGKLLQVCGGAVYTGIEKEWVELHEEKFTELDKIIKKHQGEPILVGYNFGHELQRLKSRYPQGVDIRDRKDAVHAWNSGEIPLMFAHPDSAGHGLNLQTGPGRVLVWLGLNWSLDLNKQLNKRLWRSGQAREVYIYYLIAKGRFDTRLMEGVAKYDWTQQQLLRALRRDVRTRRNK